MQDITTPREKILKKVRAALLNKFAFQLSDADYDSPVFAFADEEKAVNFAAEFTASGGGFVYCHNFFDFTENLIALLEKRGWKELACTESKLRKELENLGLPVTDKQELSGINVAITGCESLVARTGAVLLSSKHSAPHLPFYAQVHLIVATMSAVAMDMKEAFLQIRNRYGDVSHGEMIFLHGPAKTIDGARRINRSSDGASEVIVFLINDGQEEVL